MRNALLPVRAAVDDDAVAGLVDAKLPNQTRNHAVNMADQRLVQFRELVDAGNVPLRHNENMRRIAEP